MPIVLGRRSFIARIAAFFAGTALFGQAKRSEASIQGTEPMLGQIMLFAGNFPPRFWAFCNGQLLPIAQNQALFSLLGFTYGGNGVTTFALPDLRDRVPIHFGQGPGLTNRALGERAGVDAHTLLLTELPTHSHALRASTAIGTSVTPAAMYPAGNAAAIPQYGTIADAPMAAAINSVGNGQPHANTQPYLAISYCIALQGFYPS